MAKITVQLSQPWPTDAGLRRPFEGPIEVSEAEAARIVEMGAGEIIGDDAPKKGKKAGQTAADKAAAEKAAAEKAAAEKAEAEKAAAEKAASEAAANKA